jgi:PRTRC genetic system protein F
VNAVLALPRISQAVPQSVLPLDRRRANAGLARFLVEAGVLSAADVPAVWSDALEVCQRALDAWVKRQIGPLHCLSPLFVLAADDDPMRSSKRQASARYAAATLVWLEANVQQWVVGAGLEALERTHSGLGEAVLEVLRRQHAVYPLFTPDIACELVSYLHWWGEEDEEAALDAQCVDEEDRADMREQMITRQMRDAAFPAWARQWRSRTPRRPGLRQLARHVLDPRQQAIVADALALSRLHVRDDFRPQADGEFIGWGAVLSWHEDDLAVRIFDDLVNMAHESEYHEEMGVLGLPLDAPQVMADWRRAMGVRFRAIGLIDRLIHALSAGDWFQP